MTSQSSQPQNKYSVILELPVTSMSQNKRFKPTNHDQYTDILESVLKSFLPFSKL